MTTTEHARPLLEDWAKETGVKIEWFHEWPRPLDDENLPRLDWHKGPWVAVTAFGFDEQGEPKTNTVNLPKAA